MNKTFIGGITILCRNKTELYPLLNSAVLNTSKGSISLGSCCLRQSDVITYPSMVSRETVQIALCKASFHDLEVKATDELNAYVIAPNRERCRQYQVQSLGTMLVSLSLLSEHYTESRVHELCFACILHNVCWSQGTTLVMLTQICR